MSGGSSSGGGGPPHAPIQRTPAQDAAEKLREMAAQFEQYADTLRKLADSLAQP